jgi:dUTP pyrophosphatase
MKIKYKGPYQLAPAKDGDAGYDIATNEYKVVYGHTSAQFSTGLSMAIPKGYVGKVVSRSGLSFKHQIEVGAGIIDSGYRGEIKIHLHNFGDFPVQFKPGDRIAQIIILKHESPVFELVDSLDETERGVNGFGSTGIQLDSTDAGFDGIWDHHNEY